MTDPIFPQAPVLCFSSAFTSQFLGCFLREHKIATVFWESRINFVSVLFYYLRIYVWTVCTPYNLMPTSKTWIWVPKCPILEHFFRAECLNHFRWCVRIDMAVQLIDFLSDLHAKRIMHCDLKPDQFGVTPDGIIRLVDLDTMSRYKTASESIFW